jgi:hypothetical protein
MPAVPSGRGLKSIVKVSLQQVSVPALGSELHTVRHSLHWHHYWGCVNQELRSVETCLQSQVNGG